MRAVLRKLLNGKPFPMTVIRGLVNKSSIRDCEKVRYAVQLIMMAREMGLLKEDV